MMNQLKSVQSYIALAVITLCFLFSSSLTVKAQEGGAAQTKQQEVQSIEQQIQATEQEVQPTEKSDDWEAFRHEMKVRFEEVRKEVSNILEQATEKQENAVDFKEALESFETEAVAFASSLKGMDNVAVEKRDEFKTSMKAAYERLKAAHSKVKAEWEILSSGK